MLMRWILKLLLAVTVAAATAVACDVGFNGAWRGRTPMVIGLMQGPSPESTGEVRYEDLGGQPSRFEELPGGLLGVRSEDLHTYTRALFVPDLDGDGVADVALSRGNVSTCGNDVRGALELHSGASLEPIAELGGYAEFAPQVGSTGEVLELRTHGWKGPEVRVRASATAEPRWTRGVGALFSGAATFVGDVDGDGHDEVAVGDSWDRSDLDERRGSVRLLAGLEGEPLWQAVRSVHEDEAFGRAVAPAGDWNRDGRPDVAVLSERAVSILSGADGSLLERGRPAGEEELWGLEALGDLDGDGRMDFQLRVDTGPGWAWPIVASSGWAPLDVADGWELCWIAPGAVPPRAGGDLDGDGLDDLVVGRRHPETGERRLSRTSAAGLVDVRTLDAQAPGWETPPGFWHTGVPGVGRLRPGEPWTVLLPLIEKTGWRRRGLVVLLAGD